MMIEEYELGQELAELTGKSDWKHEGAAWWEDEERPPPTASDLTRAEGLQR